MRGAAGLGHQRQVGLTSPCQSQVLASQHASHIQLVVLHPVLAADQARRKTARVFQLLPSGHSSSCPVHRTMHTVQFNWVHPQPAATPTIWLLAVC